LELGNDLSDGLDTGTLQTFAQQMLQQIEAQLLLLAQNILQETDQQRTRILFAKRAELEVQRRQYLEERQNEVNIQNLRNGKSNANDLVPVFGIPQGFGIPGCPWGGPGGS
jgi:hypothetical protein